MSHAAILLALVVIVQAREETRAEARLIHQKFLLYEPVFVEGVISNQSAPSGMSIYIVGTAGVEFSCDNADFFPWIPAWLTAGSWGASVNDSKFNSSGTITVGAGFVLHERKLTNSELVELEETDPKSCTVFPKAGKYWVRTVQLMGPKSDWRPGERVTSEAVEIEIQEPEGADLNAARRIQEQGLAPFMAPYMCTGDAWKRKRNDVEQFIRDFPSSRYAGYFRVMMGVMLTGEVMAGTASNYGETTEAAIQYLRAVSEQADHPMAGDALFYLGRVQLLAGNREEARKCFEAAGAADSCHLKEAAREVIRELEGE